MRHFGNLLDDQTDSFAFPTAGSPLDLFMNLVVPVAFTQAPSGSAEISNSTVGGGIVPGSETVTFAGSQLVFQNTYLSGVTDAYRTAVLAAENELQSHISNSITISVSFGFQSLSGNAIAKNNFGNVVNVSYSTLRTALINHATTPDDIAAVNSLPTSDPSNGHTWLIAGGLARQLGLPGASNAATDVQLVLGSGVSWNFDPNNRTANSNAYDAIGAIEHEITEGGFGRVGGLGDQNSTWGPLDLFRYSSAGNRDYTDGRDGLAAFFSIDGTHLLTQFHNSAPAPSKTFDDQDPGDWDVGDDSFGFGIRGHIGTLTQTDLRVLDILGWSPNVPDDYRNALTDTSHPLGSIAANSASSGTLEQAGDRDWFQTSLVAGHHYVIREQGSAFGHGSLDDPYLRFHDSAGNLLASNDDVNTATGYTDSQISVTAAATGTYYVEAGAFNDGSAGTYSVSVAITDIETAYDFGGDGKSDVLLRNDAGVVASWDMNDGTLVRSNSFGTVPFSWRIMGTADFNGDGKADLLWQNTDGTVVTWDMNDTTTLNTRTVGALPSNWHIVGTGDFNGDYNADLLLRNDAGVVATWDLHDGAFVSSHYFGAVPFNWHMRGTADFNSDGHTDILWQNDAGDVVTWDMDNTTTQNTHDLGVVPANWHFMGTGDFNRDNYTDILWENDAGLVVIWDLNNSSLIASKTVGQLPSNWHIIDVADYNGDHKSDIIFRNDAGAIATWDMNDNVIASTHALGQLPSNWHVIV